MRTPNLLFLLVVLFSMEACSKKQQGDLYHSVKMVVGFVEDKINGVETFNLLDPNSSIPKVCKINSENKNSFNKLRSRVAFCTTQNEFTDFAHTKLCLIEIGEAFSAIKEQGCKKSVLHIESTGNAPEVMSLMLNRFYDKNITSNGVKFNWNELSNYFSLVSVWFNQTRGTMYPLGNEKVISTFQTQVFEEKINRKLWDDLQKSDDWRKTFGEVVNPLSVKNADGSLRTTEELKDLGKGQRTEFKIFETMLTVNKKLLDSLFASDLALDSTVWIDGSPAPSPLVAGMLGESLSPFFQRIMVVAKIYDIACKLKTCEHSFYENNLTYWYLKFLNSIQIGEPLKSLTLNQKDQKNPLPLFLGTLNQNRVVIKKLLDQFSLSFKESSNKTDESYPHFLLSFKKAFDESSFLISNYENSRKKLNKAYKSDKMAGYFIGLGVQEVKVGFSASMMQHHIENMKKDNTKLEELIEVFNGKRNELIDKVLAINSSAINLRVLENNINIDLKKMIEEKNKADVMRSYIHKEKVDFYEIVNAAINVKALGGNKNVFIENKANDIQIQVSAEKTGDGKIRKIIDPGHITKINFNTLIKKGDLLQVYVEGRWSPTCAISLRYGPGFKNASSDSRGFSFIKSQGVSKVSETNNYKSSEGFDATSFDIALCTGAGLPDWWIFKSSIAACATASTGHRNAYGSTNSEINSSTERSDASFELGINLDNTPFESVAAGSLLLVEMPKGEIIKSKALKINILNGTNTIILNSSSDDSDFYLIGNDCESENNSGTLKVNIKHLTTESDAAEAFVKNIDFVSKSTEAKLSKLISNGALDALDLDQFKGQLKAFGATSSFPPQMSSLLDSLINLEVSILSKKAQIVQKEREIELMDKRIQSLLDQYTSEDEARKLRVENRNWNLANMDLDFVNGLNGNVYTLNRILNTMENSLVSYIDFKYRNNNKGTILGDLTLLQYIQFSDSFEAIAKNVTSYNRRLLDNLITDSEETPTTSKTSIGIKISNPFYESDDSIEDTSGNIPVMEKKRAGIFWNKIKNFDEYSNVHDLKFEIGLNDLYTKNGLKCFVQSPIIESMGLFFIPKYSNTIMNFNRAHYLNHAILHLEGTSLIPFKYGPVEYNFVEDAKKWRFFEVVVRMAENEQSAFEIFRTQKPINSPNEPGFGTGRPIFGEFKIGNLPGHERDDKNEVFIGGVPLNEIKEVILVYELSAGNTIDFNEKMKWIDNCKKN